MKYAVFTLCLVAIAFSGSWEESYWTDVNPNIYHFLNVYVWNTNTMHQSLESLDLEGINQSEITDQKTLEAIQNAISSKSKANIAKAQCDLLYVNTVESLPVDVLGTSMFGTTYYVIKVHRFMAMQILNGSFTYCGEYGTYWKETMSYSEDAMERSSEILNQNFVGAMNELDNAKRAGLCDDDFSGKSKEMCDNASLSMLELTASYSKIGDYLYRMDEENKKYLPNETGYSENMQEIWVDAVPLAEKTYDDASTAMKTGKEDFETSKFSAQTKGNDARKKIKELEMNGFEKITEAKQEEQSEGTISERFGRLEKTLAQADGEYELGLFTYNSKHEKYLKESIVDMRNANNGYELIISSVEKLKEDAGTVVDEQKKEAVDEIMEFEATAGQETQNTYARELYELAGKQLVDGDSAPTLGAKFELYYESAANARKALVVQKKTTAELETEVKGKYSQTEEMITKASKDGIETYSETEELKLLNGIVAAWVEKELDGIQNGILQKAEIKYGYLEDERAEIIRKIQLADGKLDDLYTDMEKTEGNSFVNGKLDYNSALGKLSEIAKQYQYMNGEIDKEMKIIVSNGLKKDYLTSYEETELDSISEITLSVFLHNNYDYESKDVMVKIPSKIEFLENELVEGMERVKSSSYSSESLTIYLDKVTSYENIAIAFKTKKKLAPVLKVEKNVVGNLDGSTDTKETITFQTDYDGISVYAPAYFDKWTIDGKTKTGRKTGELEKGEHKLIGEYRIYDAFELSKQDYKAINAGLNSEVSYDLLVKPKADIDHVTLVVSEGNSDRISDFAVTAYSAGTIVKNKKSIENGMYSFDVYELKNGTEATIRVSYSIANSKQYAQEQLEQLKKVEQSTAVKALISSAETALLSNDTRRAVENVERAMQQVEKEANDKIKTEEKIENMKTKIQKEKKEIDNALLNNLDNSTQLTIKLKARQEVLAGLLNSKDVQLLDEYDPSWLPKEIIQSKKQSLNEYGKLKTNYLELNDGTANNSQFSDFENSISSLEASGSASNGLLVEANLNKVNALVGAKTDESGKEYQEIVDEAKDTNSDTETVVLVYSKEYDDAKAGKLSAVFTYDYKTVQKEMKVLDSMIAKKEAKDKISEKISEIKKLKNGMQNVLDYVQKESIRKLGSIKEIYSSKKESMNEQERKLAEQGIIQMEAQINAGNYAESINTGDAVIKVINRNNGFQINEMLVLGITALLIIGAMIIYLGKMKGGERRMPRKLRSVDD